jgi:acyl-CoA thioester hydrolase
MNDSLKLKNSTFIRVRYADTDKMGVVNNGKYLTYFEVGRTELMRANGLPYTDMENEGCLLPLIDAYAKYHQSAFYDDLLEIVAEIDLNGLGARIRFDYTVKMGEKLIATGYTSHSFVNSKTMKPTRPPKVLMNLVDRLENK